MTSKPCRIAYLIDSLSYGGAEKQLALLAEALPDPFVPVVYCLSELTDPFGKMLARKGIEVRSFRRRSHVDFFRLLSVVRALSRHKIDIVHGFLDASDVYAFLAGRILGKPVVLTLRNERLTFGGWRARLLHMMFRRAEKVMVNSRAGEAYLLNAAGVKREKVVLIRNWFWGDLVGSGREESDFGFEAGRLESDQSSETGGCETEDRSETGRVGSEDHVETGRVQSGYGPEAERGEVIGFVGRFSKQKNLEVLIRAFRIVSLERPEARLVLIGWGEEREALEALVRSMHLEGKVTFREPVPDILSEMRNFSCLVLPSSYEGLPNVVLEALSVGTPVVASAVGDVADLITDGQTGVLIDPTTPETFSDGILKVLSNPSIAENTRCEGPAMVQKNFSMEAGVEKVVGIYEEILSVGASR